MLEPMMPEYSNTMYLKGFSPMQIFSAFKQTQRRKRKDERKKKREESILEKETMAFFEWVFSVNLYDLRFLLILYLPFS